VRVLDKDGNLCPRADDLVRFALQGPGAIAAVDNGNPASLEPFQGNQRRAFSGMALLVVRSRTGAPGVIRVTASADGLASAETRITAAGP
jgi:beta-galactosidase